MNILRIASILCCLALSTSHAPAQEETPPGPGKTIRFPDIPGYVTLSCDLHMHTVFSDGHVWPTIRVGEAQKEGVDAIAMTDHIEYQPHEEDIPHPDRNRSYELAAQAAEGSDLIVINGAEITRSMPPGHANAVFLEDANELDRKDMMEAFREARRQGAFIFWNHPHWTAQREDGIARLDPLHRDLIAEGLLHGIEVVNGDTYSDEALRIALDHNLTVLGTSDVHGLTGWDYLEKGTHRPVTLAFAEERTGEGLKQALLNGRTAVWFGQTLIGPSEFLVPLIENCITLTRRDESPVQDLLIENRSGADLILENLSPYTFHNSAGILILKENETLPLAVKTEQALSSFNLSFRVLNAFTAPGEHPEIAFMVE